MQLSILPASPSVSSRVRKVAQVIRTFDDAEITQLIDLVPRLERRQSLTMVRESALRYFHDQLNNHPFAASEQFVGELTYGEYLTLSDAEEDTFWNDLFADNALSIEDYEELDVKSDAYLPAR